MLTWAMVFLLAHRPDARVDTGTMVILIACDMIIVAMITSAIRSI